MQYTIATISLIHGYGFSQMKKCKKLVTFFVISQTREQDFYLALQALHYGVQTIKDYWNMYIIIVDDEQVEINTLRSIGFSLSKFFNMLCMFFSST